MNVPARYLLKALVFGIGVHAHANTAGFTTPDFRGQAGTEFGLWDNPNNFSVPLSSSLTAPGNTANPGGTTDAVIRQLAGVPGDVIITGGGEAGNLYSFGIASQFVLSDANLSVVDTVIFQVRANGSEIDYSGVRLSYDLGAGTQFVTATRTETDRTDLGPTGFGVSSKWEFDLTGLDVRDYAISFNASAPSMSLDSVSLDTASAAVVPEPSTYALALIGGLAGLAQWRRRNSRQG